MSKGFISTMPYSSQRSGLPVIRISEGPALAVRAGEETDATVQEIMPVIDALRAVGTDIAREKLETAWVDLDNAELELRCHESRAVTPQPALGKALNAMERARENLSQAETALAMADIDKAIAVLSRA